MIFQSICLDLCSIFYDGSNYISEYVCGKVFFLNLDSSNINVNLILVLYASSLWTYWDLKF